MKLLAEPVLAAVDGPARVHDVRAAGWVKAGQTVARLATEGGLVKVRAPREGAFAPRCAVGQALRPGELVGLLESVEARARRDPKSPLWLLGPLLLAVSGGLQLATGDWVGLAILVAGFVTLGAGLLGSRPGDTRAPTLPAPVRASLARLSKLEPRALPPPASDTSAWRPLPRSHFELARLLEQERLPPEQLELLARHPEPDVAFSASLRLAAGGFEAGQAALWALVERRQPEVRVAALRAIEVLGDETALEPLARLRRAGLGFSAVQRAARGAQVELTRRFPEAAREAEVRVVASEAAGRLRRKKDGLRGLKSTMKAFVVSTAVASAMLVPMGMLAGLPFWSSLALMLGISVVFIGVPALVLGASADAITGLRTVADRRRVLKGRRVDRQAGTLSMPGPQDSPGALSEAGPGGGLGVVEGEE